MTRWQYRVVDLGAFWQRDRLVGALGRLGASGWELVVIYDKSSNWLQGFEKGFALFKRLVADGEEPDGPWAEATYASGGTDSDGIPELSETECLSCGAMMPLERDTCAACGWSYTSPPVPNA